MSNWQFKEVGDTGKVRFRLQKRWFKDPLLVLQMEITRQKRQFYDYSRTWDSWVKAENRWRDVQLEDLSVMDVSKLAFQSEDGELPVCFKPRTTWRGPWMLVLQVLDGNFATNHWREARLQDLRFKDGKIMGGVGIVTQ